MIDLPICTSCQDPDKEYLSKDENYGWICDDCRGDIQKYDDNCEQYEETKRQRIAESNEY